MYEECQEASRHLQAAKEAEAKIDKWLPPHLDFYRGLAEAERQSANTSWKAHKMGKCSCVLRDLLAQARR